MPQYPGWTLADLANHTASILGRTTLICETLPEERVSAPKLPEGKDPVDWYDECLDAMIQALEAADPDQGCWGFGSTPSLGFWESRMVIETGVHRWDAYEAFGESEGLTDHVARSGLDEFDEMWLPHLGDVPALELVATDLGSSWVFGDGDAIDRIEGTASDIYLRLVSRESPVRLPDSWENAIDSLSPPPKR